MNSLHFKAFTSVALISFITGCVVMCLLTKSCHQENKDTTRVTKAVRHEHEKSTAAFRDTLTMLNAKADALHQQLHQHKQKLVKIKNSSQPIKPTSEKSALKVGYRASDLLKRTSKTSGKTNQYSTDEVHTYNSKTESIYIELVNVQDSLLDVKDAVINTLGNQVKQQDKLIEKLIQLNEELTEENAQLKKLLKRNRRKGKILAVLAGIITGLATHQLTK